MAISLKDNATFAGRFTAADTNYPYGSSKDETSPGAGDGTQYLKIRSDDIFGFQQSLLDEAGIVPSGNAETAPISQYKEAIRTITNMRTVTHNMASDANYTLSAIQNTFRYVIITDTGVALSATRDIIVDAMQKHFIAKNETLQTLTFIISGVGVDVLAGDTVDLYNDGTDIIENLGQLSGSTNIIRNWNFDINDREYISGTPIAGTNKYTLDGWRVIGSGQSLAFSKTAGKVTITAPAGGVEQPIEGALLQSGNYKVSWEGTGTLTVDGTPRTKGEIFAITGGTNVSVKLFNGTVANFRIDSTFGPVDDRLILCKRYLPYRSETGGTATRHGVGQATTTINANIVIPTQVEARINPATVTFNGNLVLLNGASAIAVTSMATTGGTSNKKVVNINCAAVGLTAGAVYILSNNADATAFIEIPTEL